MRDVIFNERVKIPRPGTRAFIHYRAGCKYSLDTDLATWLVARRVARYPGNPTPQQLLDRQARMDDYLRAARRRKLEIFYGG